MKICFNLFPPTNKPIALLVCLLLIVIYTKLKAEKMNYEINSSSFSYTQEKKIFINSPFKSDTKDHINSSK